MLTWETISINLVSKKLRVIIMFVTVNTVCAIKHEAYIRNTVWAKIYFHRPSTAFCNGNVSVKA